MVEPQHKIAYISTCLCCLLTLLVLRFGQTSLLKSRQRKFPHNHWNRFLNPAELMTAAGNMNVRTMVERFRPSLRPFEDYYRTIHQNPELSGKESDTSLVVSKFLRSLDFIVHDNIGGHGVAGVLENGPGKTVMLRAESDALQSKNKQRCRMLAPS